MLSANESKASLLESALIAGGLLAVSAASNKLMKDSLGITVTPKNAVKIIIGVALSNYLVDFAKSKNYIDVNMFSKPATNPTT